MGNLVNSLDELVQTIGLVTGESKETVNERLLNELLLLGTNVTSDMARLKITPHYYSDKLDKYYSNNDSFLYELIVYQISRQRQGLTKRYIDIAKEHQQSYNRPCSVLCLGEGIGVDALAFLQNGFDVTYFDFPCKSYDFAEILWKRYGVRPKVINDLSMIPDNSYDIVLNSDVLEHVQHPGEVIKNISGYLKNYGVAIILASYPAIQPNLATHLFANLNYWGRTIDMFKDNKMIVTRQSESKGVPYVFKKYENNGEFMKAWLGSYFDKDCLKVRIQEFLTRTIRSKRVAAKNIEKIKSPDYLSDIVSENKSPLLHLNKK